MLVGAALQACRGFNSTLDIAFYDVPTLVVDLKARGEAVETQPGEVSSHATRPLDLDALTNPEGALLVVDTAAAAPVLRFEDLAEFLAWRRSAPRKPTTVSITGVGSSALGSAALAWDVAKTTGAPVIAIVPGYGVADALLQGLGGWFGFGLHDALGTKTRIQDALALTAPEIAKVGHRLLASLPDGRRPINGAPVFRTGCGSSDVLHALMKRVPVDCVVGHSKGALAIGNALNSLDADEVKGLRVVTLGCPIAETIPGATYHQYLGVFDALGQANAWGHKPNAWVATDHSTNAALPLSMDAGALAKEGAAA
jgi:hypothetical protein